ncbi:hypothetical protein [Streptomyces sp. AVP053U2]|uniref:hypothetical protein n=1 Tax=Streptomyces sp. AVP053U2 TaxID=1737066 RepID=UPI00073CE1F5|nr:hypothetical protein [Streptomyces sp. AVP053U2]ODA70276.1 hypothetical protein APS67_005502 [Streptomyces sp. AVP053U2]
MNPTHAYAIARQLIDPDANYTVHIHTDTGWTQPTDTDHRELPGLDVLLAARRVLRARPVGHVQSTSPNSLDIRTGDGQLWLRLTTASPSAVQVPGEPAPGSLFGGPEDLHLGRFAQPVRAVQAPGPSACD